MDLGLFWGSNLHLDQFGGSLDPDLGLFGRYGPVFRPISGARAWIWAYTGMSSLILDLFLGVRAWIWAYFGGVWTWIGAYFGWYGPGFGPVLGSTCLDLILFLGAKPGFVHFWPILGSYHFLIGGGGGSLSSNNPPLTNNGGSLNTYIYM